MAINFNHINSTISLSNDVLRLSASGGLIIPTGTSSNRPFSEEGTIRFNINSDRLEMFNSSFGWSTIPTKSEIITNVSSSTIDNGGIDQNGVLLLNLSESGVTPSTYNSITVDIYGRVIVGQQIDYITKSSSRTLFSQIGSSANFSSLTINSENSYTLPTSAGNTGDVLISNGGNNKAHWKNTSPVLIELSSQETFSITDTNQYILVSCQTTSILTLPSSAELGGKISIKDINGQSSIFTITVSASNGYLIDGESSFLINSNFGYIELIFVGDRWIKTTNTIVWS